MNYLGIDWGEKRIGLAIADGETKMATPFRIAASADEVIQVLENEAIDLVVIGKPTSMTNCELPISNEKYNNFLKDLKEKSKIKIKLIDERLTSKAADALAGSKKTKASRDEIAAMLILQSYLDRV